MLSISLLPESPAHIWCCSQAHLEGQAWVDHICKSWGRETHLCLLSPPSSLSLSSSSGAEVSGQLALSPIFTTDWPWVQRQSHTTSLGLTAQQVISKVPSSSRVLGHCDSWERQLHWTPYYSKNFTMPPTSSQVVHVSGYFHLVFLPQNTHTCVWAHMWINTDLLGSDSNNQIQMKESMLSAKLLQLLGR